MNYIVMDLEWNQGFRGRDRESETIPFEIIEIGAVKLNSDFYETGTFSRLIKPQIYREMHQITSQLVHINMLQLQREKSFVEVMEDFPTLYYTNVEVKVQEEIKRAKMIPQNQEISIEKSGNECGFAIPEITGHQMVVLEY